MASNMFPGMGGRGMNPKQMNQMMKQLGIQVEDIDNVEEVVIKTATKEIVITDVQVTVMTAQGTRTYQIVGEATERPLADAPKFAEEDVALVAEQAGVSEDAARAALEEADGEPAEAILKLTEGS